METTTKPRPTKTLRVWLEDLPENLREKALHYNEVQGYTHRLDYEFTSGFAALALAFDSMNTPEGSVYWAGIACDNFEKVY